MPFKIIEIGDDIQLISCLTKGAVADDDLQFFCHHKNEELSYCEKLPMLQFDQRIRVSLPLEVFFHLSPEFILTARIHFIATK